jgi:isopentenyl-diphosphate Delta-isomerase
MPHVDQLSMSSCAPSCDLSPTNFLNSHKPQISAVIQRCGAIKTRMAAKMCTASAPDKDIIVVNSADEEVGQDFKASVHAGDGILHRAFSVYLFDRQLRLLLQQRSEHKPLWPGYWSNSCCSHPRPGESTRDAAIRRVREELGLAQLQSLRFLFKFQYHARYELQGAEHEMCSVYAGIADRPICVDRDEVADVRFVAAPQLDSHLERDSPRYTPWLHLAWRRIRANHWKAIDGLSHQLAV